MDIEVIKSLVYKHKDYILKIERDLWKMPEVGFREYKTNAYIKEEFLKLGYEITEAENITGFYTLIDTGVAGPTVLVLAELDSLYCSDHPECDKETKAVHVCGHHAQCAAMLGLAKTLKEDCSLEGLSGKIKLCLVPAEESIEIEYRMELIKKGIISFPSGKKEFLARGYFDDVDVAFMVHTTSTLSNTDKLFVSGVNGHNGTINKKVVIKGKAAHAGSKPWDGKNALNAAALAIQAVNNLRETFKEEDTIRFHPIITKGGDAVNAVPAEIIMESYVRGATREALFDINKRINRAISAAVASNGCTVIISDVMGSEPFKDDENLSELCLSVFEEIGGKDCYRNRRTAKSTASTDMGDVAVNIPSIQPYVAGAVGLGHSKTYYIADPVKACVNSSILQFALIRRLLENDAKRAIEIKNNFKPIFPTIKDYVVSKKEQSQEREMIKVNKDGSITII